MRRVSSIVVVALLFTGCAQLGGQKGGSAGGQGTAAKPANVCGAVSGAISELDGLLARLSHINLCLAGDPVCPTKENAKNACAARDALAGFHTSNGCTDVMVGPRPGLCNRL